MGRRGRSQKIVKTQPRDRVYLPETPRRYGFTSGGVAAQLDVRRG